PAPETSATSSAQPSTSPTSNTGTYRTLVEITSIDVALLPRALGSMSVPEIESVRAGGIFAAERDLYWRPTRLREVMAACRKGEHL
ncbi:hypothetical protein, partial [Pilimelia columellifera]|uniref:hypothetical protein n=1 Tax=Pilimelia columellifera TaxID=706574 RepID=UPI0031E2877F